MSADLYASEIDDSLYGSLVIEMNVNGYLKIEAFDVGSDEQVGCCQFPPTPEGFNEVKRMIGALQEWMIHNMKNFNTKDEVRTCRVDLKSDALSHEMTNKEFK